MQTVAETPMFSRQADKLFREDERRERIDYLADHPLAGDEIPETGEGRQDRPGPRRAASGRQVRRHDQASRKAEEMSTFGEGLIQSLNAALAHAKGEGPAIVHAPISPREVRMQAELTQAQMATSDGYESVRLPRVGTGEAACQRSGRDVPAHHQARSQRSQGGTPGIAVTVLDRAIRSGKCGPIFPPFDPISPPFRPDRFRHTPTAKNGRSCSPS